MPAFSPSAAIATGASRRRRSRLPGRAFGNTGAMTLRRGDQERRRQGEPGADQVRRRARGADRGEDQRPEREADRERGDVGRHRARAGALVAELVDPGLRQREQRLRGGAEHEAQRKPEPDPGHRREQRQHDRGEDERAQRHPPRPDPRHDARQDQRDRQHAERMHRGIEADHRSRGAALGEIERDQRRAQGVGEAEDRGGGDHRGKRQQMTARRPAPPRGRSCRPLRHPPCRRRRCRRASCSRRRQGLRCGSTMAYSERA